MTKEEKHFLTANLEAIDFNEPFSNSPHAKQNVKKRQK